MATNTNLLLSSGKGSHLNCIKSSIFLRVPSKMSGSNPQKKLKVAVVGGGLVSLCLFKICYVNVYPISKDMFQLLFRRILFV